MGRRDPFIGELVPSSLQAGVAYLIESRLGEGGTALAYRARRRAADGEAVVVIKVILPHIVAESDDQALTIIKKEAVALGRLNERIPPTPNVVRLIDTGCSARSRRKTSPKSTPAIGKPTHMITKTMFVVQLSPAIWVPAKPA